MRSRAVKGVLIVLLIAACEAPRETASRRGTYDNFERLVGYPGKVEATCPKQTSRVAVMLAIGQSNIANHGLHKYATRHPSRVLNYFAGKCYVAGSPLLGASGEEGEWITPMADALVEAGAYDAIVIISSGVHGTPISRWQRGGDLNGVLLGVLAKLGETYRVTHILWHQGESDFRNLTSTEDYMKGFESMVQTLRQARIAAPIFMSIATRCADYANWFADNPTAIAQRKLVDDKAVFLGVDTDRIVLREDRDDICHYRESGQLKTASAVATAIGKAR